MVNDIMLNAQVSEKLRRYYFEADVQRLRKRWQLLKRLEQLGPAFAMPAAVVATDFLSQR